MPNLPMISSAVWKLLTLLLPPSARRPGKPRQDDRRYVSAFFYAEATRCSLDCLPAAYGNPRSLRTRRQRWQADGTLARLMEAGAPVIERMRNTYLGWVRDATLDWQNSTEFFGRVVISRQPHMQPKIRRPAALNRRQPAAARRDLALTWALSDFTGSADDVRSRGFVALWSDVSFGSLPAVGVSCRDGLLRPVENGVPQNVECGTFSQPTAY